MLNELNDASPSGSGSAARRGRSPAFVALSSLAIVLLVVLGVYETIPAKPYEATAPPPPDPIAQAIHDLQTSQRQAVDQLKAVQETVSSDRAEVKRLFDELHRAERQTRCAPTILRQCSAAALCSCSADRTGKAEALEPITPLAYRRPSKKSPVRARSSGREEVTESIVKNVSADYARRGGGRPGRRISKRTRNNSSNQRSSRLKLKPAAASRALMRSPSRPLQWSR